ncbi:ATP-dependent nuclease [Gemmatimonas groenlandica]|uniref:ATP-dependent endonuclease n=1 Tax=Gemmatimonas groenlandica TaxID=2732249 RepID=A0A6M4IX71_9BACT|nr:AAA family ATPase [Gemmatimonas groenlandica]QJR36781.1 ATP-dependent endonuclease [Gemmatimonas groenlandica]
MRISAIRIRHFRSIEELDIPCSDLTALVGRNGAGKSCILRALEAFYSGGQGISGSDFHHNDTSSPIAIGVTYEGLPAEAQSLFGPYMVGGQLQVDVVIVADAGRTTAKYHGSRLVRAAFGGFRRAESATDRKTAYNALRSTADFSELPAWQNQAQGAQALEDWEAAHPESLERDRDDGQFFGFKGVGQGYLGRFTRLLSIPAVRDAGQFAVEGRGSPLTQLIDLLVRSTLGNRADITAFRADMQQKYADLLSPDAVPELNTLQADLAQTLASFAPNTGLALRWKALGTLEVPLPTADVALVEDAFEAPVDKVGHGLQRAFVLSVLQKLAVSAVAADEGGQTDPSLVIAFEEPELYQHPSRQRHIAEMLRRLAHGAGGSSAHGAQILYSTHSPLLVGIDRFDDVRVLRKKASSSEPARSRTILARADASDVAQRMWVAFGSSGSPFTAAGERARMAALMTPIVNEGFFADCVVLVEGESDRAAILAQAARVGFSLDAAGCAVVPCIGKSGMLRPYAVFSSIGIPIYAVWDGDQGKSGASAEDNLRLQRLLGIPEVDWPPFTVAETYACYPKNMEESLKADIGAELFQNCIDAALQEFGLSKRADGMKNPLVVQRLLESAAAAGIVPSCLSSIVGAIRVMANAA